MDDVVIRAEELSKSYRIGRMSSYGTLRDSLVRLAGAPLRAARRLGSSDRREARPEIWALKDVSFEICKGEVVGIIGANGAGKTTLLKVLSRITEPTSGRVRLRGKLSSLLEVGTGFHPELTGRENIFLNGAILGMPRREIERKFDEIIAFAEIEQFVDTPVKRYSSGMYVRLAFAVGAHMDPDLLLVDEVLAVGDASFQKKCLGKLEDVQRVGRTVLFVSHNMSAIQKLCPRTMLFAGGEIEEDGETRQVVGRYLSQDQDATGSELSERPRREGQGRGIRLTDCEIRNATGDVTRSLDFGEPFSICLTALPEQSYKALRFLIRFDSANDDSIAFSMSDEAGLVLEASPGVALKTTARFDELALSPGTYWLTIGILGERGGLDHIHRAVAFDVTSRAHEGVRLHPGTWGFIRANSKWEGGEA